MQNRIKTPQEILDMRRSGRILEEILIIVQKATRSGMSTKDLADIAAAELKRRDAKPVFLGYYGFPHVLCVSVNDEVIHGIPRHDHIINEGDIVSIDFGVNFNGMITDAARSFVVGNTNSSDKLLIQKTEQALLAGISVVRNKTHVGSISAAIQEVLEKSHLGIVRDFVGHGVGHQLHEEPNVPNYGRANTGPVLHEGMTIAIEPMATLGGDAVMTDADGWTVRTRDGKRAAHFEDTLLVTADGYEVLTRTVE